MIYNIVLYLKISFSPDMQCIKCSGIDLQALQSRNDYSG
jgi:hypothetical protein